MRYFLHLKVLNTVNTWLTCLLAYLLIYSLTYLQKWRRKWLQFQAKKASRTMTSTGSVWRCTGTVTVSVSMTTRRYSQHWRVLTHSTPSLFLMVTWLVSDTVNLMIRLHLFLLGLFSYLIGSHYLPYFEFGYSKKSKLSISLYHIIPNILCGLNLPKHLQGLIIIGH